jgi:hypothetical protein
MEGPHPSDVGAIDVICNLLGGVKKVFDKDWALLHDIVAACIVLKCN